MSSIQERRAEEGRRIVRDKLAREKRLRDRETRLGYTIHGGDGSAWLAELQQEQDMKAKYPTEASAPMSTLRLSRGSARQQQQMNRLQHSRWPHEVERPMLSIPWTIALGLALAGFAVWAVLSLPMPV